MRVYKSLETILKILQNEENMGSPKIEELLTIYQTKKSQSEHVKRWPLIVFEGLDGSGKSTIIKVIKESINAKSVATPPECVKHLCQHFNNKPAELRAAFYSLSNYIAAEEIKEMLVDSTVLLDRFWHSTCAFAVGNEVCKVSNLPPEGSELYEWPEDLLKPDAVIFLDVPEHMRIQRLSRRANFTAEEERLKNDNEFRNACIIAMQRMMKPSITSVMSNKPVKKVASFTIDKLLTMGLNIERKPTS